jgi:hypothetical protein
MRRKLVEKYIGRRIFGPCQFRGVSGQYYFSPIPSLVHSSHKRHQTRRFQSKPVTVTRSKVDADAPGMAELDPGTGRKCSASSFCSVADSCIVGEQGCMVTREEVTHLEGNKSDEDPRSKEDESYEKPENTPYCVRYENLIINTWQERKPWDGKHPQIRANADASELFTLRVMVSSTDCYRLPKREGLFPHTNDVPKNV